MNEKATAAAKELKEIIESSKFPDADKIRIDFSLVDDMNYYNGLIFKGFVEGESDSVLSGGQYDKMMQKMKRKSKSIGFAVYLDAISR